MSVRVVGFMFSAMLVALAGGCATSSAVSSVESNPSFDISVSAAKKLLREMRDDPRPLERPLVILAGYCDPGIASSHLRGEFRKLTHDDRIVGVSFMFCGDFESCKRQVIEAVEKAFPSDDEQWTTEVDVIAVSMGGLVGRFSAAPDPYEPESKRLKIARLFTISSPHRGAILATMPTFNSLQIDMRANSRFLRALERREARDSQKAESHYELYPYVRLGDVIVGAENAAPEGQSPIWVPGEPLSDSHIGAPMDARIIADITRRLRGECPLATDPPEPLPSQEGEPEAHADASR
jgi:hypothetical protein